MRFLLWVIVAIVLIAGAFFIYDSQGAAPMPPASSTATSTTAALPVIIPGTPSVIYEDPQSGFSMYYPSTALLETAGFEGYLPLTQSPVIAFTLNTDMFQGTNLGEAGVYVGATSSPAIVADCMNPSSDAGETQATSSQTINGTAFSVFDSTGAAAGNIYQEKAFRTVENGSCFEIVELLHSSQIGNYPPGKVVAFDQAKFSSILDAMVATFAFKSAQ